jgi:hypothetical protein
VKHNLPLRRIHVLGVGEDVPNADNSTREARQQNRRVDVNVYARTIEGASGTPTASTANQGTTTGTGQSTGTTGTTTPQP